MAAHDTRNPPGWLPPGYAPPEQHSLFDLSRLFNLTPAQRNALITVGILFILTNVTFYRLSTILSRPKPKKRSSKDSSHLLIILGSGGHTAEMLNILQNINILDFSTRTYVISSGDNFSAAKVADFESGNEGYDICTVRRARKVHQSLFTAPASALLSLYDCIKLLRCSPDLIITNGPGTGVCVVIAAIIHLFWGGDRTKMRTIFIESWARAKTLSLSGRILKPLVDRFIVQWPELEKIEGSKVEFIGQLMS